MHETMCHAVLPGSQQSISKRVRVGASEWPGIALADLPCGKSALVMQLFGNQGDRSPSRGLLLVRLWLPKTENLVHLLY